MFRPITHSLSYGPGLMVASRVRLGRIAILCGSFRTRHYAGGGEGDFLGKCRAIDRVFVGAGGTSEKMHPISQCCQDGQVDPPLSDRCGDGKHAGRAALSPERPRLAFGGVAYRERALAPSWPIRRSAGAGRGDSPSAPKRSGASVSRGGRGCRSALSEGVRAAGFAWGMGHPAGFEWGGDRGDRPTSGGGGSGRPASGGGRPATPRGRRRRIAGTRVDTKEPALKPAQTVTGGWIHNKKPGPCDPG